MKTPVTLAPEALDFARLIQEGDTIGWAQATAEPVFLTRLLNAQAPRCPPFRLFFALNFATDFAADHPHITVTASGGAGAGRRFFAGGADNVVPANVSALCDLVASGRPRIDVVLLQVGGPDAAGNYNAGLGIDCLREMIEGARLVVAQVNPMLPWTAGDTLIRPGIIDILVPQAHPALELPARTIGAVERKTPQQRLELAIAEPFDLGRFESLFFGFVGRAFFEWVSTRQQLVRDTRERIDVIARIGLFA